MSGIFEKLKKKKTKRQNETPKATSKNALSNQPSKNKNKQLDKAKKIINEFNQNTQNQDKIKALQGIQVGEVTHEEMESFISKTQVSNSFLKHLKLNPERKVVGSPETLLQRMVRFLNESDEKQANTKDNKSSESSQTKPSASSSTDPKKPTKDAQDAANYVQKQYTKFLETNKDLRGIQELQNNLQEAINSGDDKRNSEIHGHLYHLQVLANLIEDPSASEKYGKVIGVEIDAGFSKIDIVTNSLFIEVKNWSQKKWSDDETLDQIQGQFLIQSSGLKNKPIMIITSNSPPQETIKKLKQENNISVEVMSYTNPNQIKTVPPLTEQTSSRNEQKNKPRKPINSNE